MLERLKQQVSPYLKARRWYIAYSGGLDSHVLLHALVSLAKENHHFPELVAVHVNHQIQSSANAWELHCQHQAELLGVSYLSFRVNVDSTRNVEAHARSARYQAFIDLLEVNDCIFFAHHQQDQIETFFYRLFRGAGIKGLLAMSHERALGNGRLVRPFLRIEHQALAAYAVFHHLDYIDDPSNKDISYDRNFIRHQLFPVVGQRWPMFQDVVQRVIRHLHEADELLDELATVDLATCKIEAGIQPSLCLSQLSCISLNRQKNLLRFWLGSYSILLSDQQTKQLFNAVIHAREDAQPLLNVGAYCLRRYSDRLYITSGLSPDNPLDSSLMHWNGMADCPVGDYGKLSLSSPLDIDLIVKKRSGGEIIKPVGSSHTRKLKTLLQERGIPPWQRDSVPLIYYGKDLIAVGDWVVSDKAHEYLQGRKIIRR